MTVTLGLLAALRFSREELSLLVLWPLFRVFVHPLAEPLGTALIVRIPVDATTSLAASSAPMTRKSPSMVALLRLRGVLPAAGTALPSATRPPRPRF